MTGVEAAAKAASAATFQALRIVHSFQ